MRAMLDQTMPETLPQGEEKAAAVRSMFDAIAPRYDLVNRIMTFRLDVRWRRLAVGSLALRRDSLVVDLACGMLVAARTNAPLVQGDALRLPVRDGAVDGVTCGFALRNLVDLAPFFAELRRVLRPGGRIALLEVAEPANPVLRWGHGIYFGKVVPKIGGLLSDASAFTAVERRLLSGGISQLLAGTRRS